MVSEQEDLADRFEDLHIDLELPGTQLYRGDQCLGTGVLHVDEHKVSWGGDNGEKVTLMYPEICLHAVSRDVSSFPHPCLYMLTTGALQDGGSEEDEDEDEAEEPAEPESVELRLVLENSENLERLFETISEAQTLHPDPEDLSTEDEDDDDPEVLEDVQPLADGAGFFRTAEDLQFLSPEGQRTLEHIEGLLAASEEQPSVQNGDGDDSQFEDAES